MFAPTIKAKCSTFFIRESSCHDAGIYNFDTIPWKIWIFDTTDKSLHNIENLPSFILIKRQVYEGVFGLCLSVCCCAEQAEMRAVRLNQNKKITATLKDGKKPPWSWRSCRAPLILCGFVTVSGTFHIIWSTVNRKYWSQQLQMFELWRISWEA